MTIVAISVIAARRAAAAAAAAAAEHALNDTASHSEVHAVKELPPPARQRRGHAVKDENGKWQPTGDRGWCRPPVDQQFKPGGNGGPGRPKGSVSQDTLLKKHLNEKRPIVVSGRKRNVTNRELVVMTTVKAGLEGKDRDARKFLLAESARIFPDQGGRQAASSADLNASDALTMRELKADLRRQILAEEKTQDAPKNEGDPA